MVTEKTLFLKTHPCVRGLADEAVGEIAEACEVMRFSPGEIVHRANDVVTAIYFVVQGRLRLSTLDLRNNETLQGFQTAGGQFGGLAAMTSEPLAATCSAVDPTLILRLDIGRAIELTRLHEPFRINVARLVSESVKQTLFPAKRPRKPNFVALLHHSPETRQVSRRLYARLTTLGERIAVLRDDCEWPPIDGVLERRVDPLSSEETRLQVSDWLEQDCRIFFDVGTSIDPRRGKVALEACVQVYWCVTPANWQSSVDLLRELQSDAPALREKVIIVWLLDRETEAPCAASLRELCAGDIKMTLRSPQDRENLVLANGFERLLHMVRGLQIGIALGGGAARGMAHLGVLKALEENGIFVDQIAGTSAGAMTGTLYASGMGVDYSVESFVNGLKPSWPFSIMPRGDEWYLLYKYRRRHFDPMLREYLSDKRLEQLPVVIKTITLDLICGQVVIRDRGDAVNGILESINLPVLSLPIIRDGQALIDGGMINNVPADVLVSSGCNFVIAVSVTAKMEQEFAYNKPDTPADAMKRASTIQTVMRTYLVQNTSINARGVQPADIVIEPDVSQFELTEFSRTDELAMIGEQATLEALPAIKALLHQLDPQLFPVVDPQQPR